MNTELKTMDRNGNNGSGTGVQASDAGRSPAAPGPFVVPHVDIFETAEGITLYADLPGVSRDRLGIRVDGDNLLIEGSVDTEGQRAMEMLYGEARHASYRRQFTLSRELDRSRIDASLKDGLLKLAIPKAEEAKPRRIEVKLG